MPFRKELLVKGEIYHVFNKSVANQEILNNRRNIRVGLEILDYYRFHQKIRYSKYKLLNKDLKRDYQELMRKSLPLVDIYSFTFMPNHYHFLVKQTEDDGIKKFISNFQNSFARYFNLKNKRSGALFLNPFKAKRIETDEIFTHVSRYIHLNPITSYLVKPENLIYCYWNSYGSYVTNSKIPFVNTVELLKLFSSRNYSKFVMDQVDYQRKLHLLKSFIIE